MSYEILEYRDIPNPIAKKILTEYIEKISQKDIVSELVRITHEYLSRMTKCGEEEAEKLYNEFLSLNLKESTVSLIINIVPRSLDELKTVILTFEENVPEDSVLNKILELLNQYCPQE